MKIAVTTASGKLGSAIIRELIRRIGTENVVGVARTPEKAENLGIQIFQGDYNESEGFFYAFQDVDAVLLVSGMDTPDKRIGQHQNVIHAAKEAGVRKIVYTSIFGKDQDSSFNPVIQSNRQTEADIKKSGMDWVIGRNGLYIEADLEYIPTYVEFGKIENSAGDGLCAYTSRSELARAYAEILLNDDLNHNTYNLCGEPVSQAKLTNAINIAFGTSLPYHAVDKETYLKDRQGELGEFMGRIIAGIYNGIHDGGFNILSDFEQVMNRKHYSIEQMIEEFRSLK